MIKLHCIECGKKLYYYSDPNPIRVAWSLDLSGYVITLMLNNIHFLDLPHKILRRDLKGYWFCKKHHSFIIFDIKRYKRKFLIPFNQLIF